MVYIILGNGFEEIEAVAPMDILKRGGVDISYAGIGSTVIKGAHDIHIRCDTLVRDVDMESVEMLIIPGGLGGVESIEASREAMSLIKKVYEKGLPLAAICAGPRVLASLKILDGIRAVCYPGMEEQIGGAVIDNSLKAVTDGRIITGRGPGTALDFGLEILKYLKGWDRAKEIASDMTYDY